MIPITKPLMGEAEAAAARRVIESGWTAQGPEVQAFEAEVAAYLGAAHACAVSNCTTALHLALLVSGVGPGDEVVTVSHSFVATANSILHCGATPVFVDIEPTTSTSTQGGSMRSSRSARERSSACTKWACRAIWSRSWRSPSGIGCPSSRMPRAPLAARSRSAGPGSALVGRTATLPAFRSTRVR